MLALYEAFRARDMQQELMADHFLPHSVIQTSLSVHVANRLRVAEDLHKRFLSTELPTLDSRRQLEEQTMPSVRMSNFPLFHSLNCCMESLIPFLMNQSYITKSNPWTGVCTLCFSFAAPSFSGTSPIDALTGTKPVIERLLYHVPYNYTLGLKHITRV